MNHISVDYINQIDLVSDEYNVKNGKYVSKCSKYRDNVWDFSYEFIDDINTKIFFDKREIGDHVFLTDPGYEKLCESTKDMILSFVQHPVKPRYKFVTIYTQWNTGYKKLLRWMYEYGFFELREISYYDYLSYLSDSLATLKEAYEVVNRGRLWHYGGIFQWLYGQLGKVNDTITFNPERIESRGSIVNYSTWVNQNSIEGPVNGKTLRIPDKYVRAIIDEAKNVIRLGKIAGKVQNERIKFAKTCHWQDASIKALNQPGVPFSTFREVQRALKLTRGACIFLIGIFSGMRRWEIRSLDIDCIGKLKDHEGDYIHYLKGYTKKTFPQKIKVKWFVHEIAIEAVETLISCFDNLRGESMALFVGRQKYNRLSYSHILYDLQFFIDNSKNLKKVLDDWKISLHQLRKTYARVMTIAGSTWGVLKEQFKHRSVLMTMEYGDPDLFEELNEQLYESKLQQARSLIEDASPVAGAGAGNIRALRKKYRRLKTAEDREQFILTLASSASFCSSGLGLCVFNAQSQNPCVGSVGGGCNPVECEQCVAVKSIHGRIYRQTRRDNEKLLPLAKTSIQRRTIQREIDICKEIEESWVSAAQEESNA